MYKSKEELIIEIQKKYSNVGFFRRIFSWKDIINNIETEIKFLDDTNHEQELLDQLQKEKHELNTINATLNNDLDHSKNTASKLEQVNKQLEDKLSSLSQQLEIQSSKLESELEIVGTLRSQIEQTNNDMLKYTKELHTVFRSSTGSQGKLSEKKLETILQGMFGDEGETWITNLQVGDGRVEFAIKPDPVSDKWVPVDSKSLVPEIDDNNEFVLDSKYFNKVKAAGKEISSKYIGKNNTESYAIMVLPSEAIYNDLFYVSGNETLIKDLSDMNVYMTSPSNFIQFASTVYKLNDRIKIVEESKNIVSEINTAFEHMVNFSNSATAGLKQINMAFNSHMPKVEKKLTSISTTIDSTKKITSVSEAGAEE